MTRDNSQPAVAGRAKPRLSRRLHELPFGVAAAARVLAGGLKFVYATNRTTFEPVSREAVFEAHAPFIVVCWHGQGFALPVMRLPQWPVDVLVSRSADAEIMAQVVSNLGLGVIRGSGSARPERVLEKGGIDAFRGMKAALEQGHSVALTADFLRNARRKVSPGVILLARLTGRPILPVAVASSRRLTFNSWDRTTITLPFGHTAVVAKDAVTVPRRADEAQLEAARLDVETRLNGAFARAYEIVDRKRG